MSDVTGPIVTLPGSEHAVPAGVSCDDCAKPATRRIQGETDSFGAEMHDLCDDCAADVQLGQVNTAGQCDWCQAEAPSRVPARDYDEGLSGRVYQVCVACRERQQQRLAAENDDYWEDHYREERDEKE